MADIPAPQEDTLEAAPVRPALNIDSLRNPPVRLAEMRQRLFSLPEKKIELLAHEFEQYWPYVDNIWVRQHKAGADRSGRHVTDYYACRLQRATNTPSPRKEGADVPPARKKQLREGGTCRMRLKRVRFVGGYESVTIVRLGDALEHTHSLEHIDQVKRASALMEMARSEVLRGYMPASVYTIMRAEGQKLVDAGGTFLSSHDVRNASLQWRQEHKDQELRVHRGWRYDRGSGIVRDSAGEHGADWVTTEEGPGLGEVEAALTDGTGNAIPASTLHFPVYQRRPLEAYLPHPELNLADYQLPHVTLTYATSLDSSLTLAAGTQTRLSGAESKSMTHYLRSRHEAILIGVGTAVADDPGLNCRIEGAGGYGGLGWEKQPQPLIIDPQSRWTISPDSRIIQTVMQGKGRGPWIVTARGNAIDQEQLAMLEYYGGKYLRLSTHHGDRLQWEAILRALAMEGIRSVMIEGGGNVINDLLQPENARLVSSVIVTIAPTYLGGDGVIVSPSARFDQSGCPQPAIRFDDVKWLPLGEDVVLCARPPTL